MAEPYFIGWYHEHAIRIFKDAVKSPGE